MQERHAFLLDIEIEDRASNAGSPESREQRAIRLIANTAKSEAYSVFCAFRTCQRIELPLHCVRRQQVSAGSYIYGPRGIFCSKQPV